MRYLFIITLLYNTAFAQTAKSFMNGDIQLFYEEFGKGPALYILTGGPGAPPDVPSYQLIDSLKSDYTVVLLHQRGSGKSRNLPINGQTIRIANYLQDIALLQNLRKDRQIVLLGISWGGLLAMNYAANHPGKVSRLVLLGSAPPSYKLWNVLFDNQQVRRSPAEADSMALLVKLFSSKTDRELDSLKHTDPGSPEVVALKQFMAIHVRAMHFNKANASIGFDQLFRDFNFQPIPFIDKEVMETKWDITDALKKTIIPALILYGRQDDQGESTFFLQKECLKNSEMHVIEQCGHIMWVDQPQEFYRVLLNYLRKNRGKTASQNNP